MNDDDVPAPCYQVMNASGFKFMVHPTAWLVHRPHAMTAAKLQHARDYQVGRNAGSVCNSIGFSTTICMHACSTTALLMAATVPCKV